MKAEDGKVKQLHAHHLLSMPHPLGGGIKQWCCLMSVSVQRCSI